MPEPPKPAEKRRQRGDAEASQDAPSRRQCRGTNQQGRPCRGPPLRGQEWCGAHHPDGTIRQRWLDQTCRVGGRYKPATLGATFASKHKLTDPAGVLAAVDALFKLYAKGRRRSRHGWIRVGKEDVRLGLALAETALRAWTLANPGRDMVTADGQAAEGAQMIEDL